MSIYKNTMHEKTLTTKDRNDLNDSDFGIPEERKFPLTDAIHVKSAIRYFSKAEDKYKKELAKRIKRKADKFGISISKDTDVAKYLYEDTILENNNSKTLYFLSNTAMDEVILKPRVPDNFLIKNGYEDNKTKRVCFAPSIDKALMALSRNLKGEKLCVHVAVNYENLKTKKPSLKEVPDSKITGEIWILEPVELKYIGDIKVLKDKGLDGHKFKYGDKEAELYDWDWKWIKKFNKDGIEIVNESTKNKTIHIKTKKKYTCPYCGEKKDRENLVYHIQDNHEEYIPKDYSAARIVFNLINHKEHGTCIVCGKETKWKEETWKYARICEDPKCSKILKDKATQNCKKKTGKTPKELLSDPTHQNKMLKGRKISGVYTFKDGGKRDYVGSYEKNLLEFYDQVLNVHSSEIMTPGPTIEYTYKGKKHFWITDLYYITANLAHDVKDGGDNPNNRDMKEYREKQLAKEKAISEQGEYNYIRLTNNNFAQLLETLSDIRLNLMDNTSTRKTISRVYEYMALGGMNPVIGSGCNYIINYGIGNAFIGQGYTTDKVMSNVYIVKDKKVKKENPKDFLSEYDSITMYKCKNNKNIKEKINEAIENDTEVDDFFFYNLLTENVCLESIQIEKDNRFVTTSSFYEYLNMVSDVIENTIKEDFNKFMANPTLSINLEALVDENNNFNKIKVLENEHGIYIENTNGIRSGYYKDEVPKEIYKILKESC